MIFPKNMEADNENCPWYIEEGSETGKLARSIDWKKTSLGPMENWPMSFKTSLSICLASRFPMLIWLGDDLTILYNDAYTLLIGKKHPNAFGKPGSQSWGEIWPTIGPMLASVKDTGKATWTNDLLLVVDRYEFYKESYWTFSYSPIRSSKHRVDGVFTAVEETSIRYISERRLRTLRDLSAKTTPTAGNPNDAVLKTGKDALNTLQWNFRTMCPTEYSIASMQSIIS